MTACGDIKLGKINAIGKSKAGYEKAINKGIKEFLSEGQSGCTGPCNGGSCTFRPINLSIKLEQSVQDETYYAYVSGSGECYCG